MRIISITYDILYDFFSPPIKKKKAESKSVVEFLIRLCHDVLLDVLRCGNRHQLAELEKNGDRFHWFIDFYFKEAPFLRLEMGLVPWYLILFQNYSKIPMLSG